MKIIIEQAVYDKIMHWINSTDIEVSGFGKVIFDNDTQTFRAVDAFLSKQEGGGSHTDIDQAGLGELMFKTKDLPGDLNWWWHSHVNMPVFWSTTDMETIKALGRQGYIVATVFNKKYEHRSATYYKATTAFGENYTLHDPIDCKIERPLPLPEEILAWDAEFKDNVIPKPYAYGQWLGTRGFTSAKDNVSGSENEKNGNIVDATNYKAQTPSLLSSDNDDEWGILGYGIEIEAQALGIFAYQLRQVIKRGKHDADYIKYEKELEAIEKEEGWHYGSAYTNYGASATKGTQQ